MPSSKDDSKISKNEPNVVDPNLVNYSSYLKVPELTSLQHPLSDPQHHDELLFIVIHQAYELWFKLILHELENAILYMNEVKPLRAQHFVKRTVEILKVLCAQIHILETMEPAEFLKFRYRLNPASGFQSVQFREFEFVAGLKERKYLDFFKDDPALVARLEKRLAAPDLRSTYYGMLKKLGFEFGDIQKEESKPEILNALKTIYEKPSANLPLYLLSESLVDLDECIGLWRKHHVIVVERVIGNKRGTGGSSGVEYLASRADLRAFPYLWEVRTLL